jgi:hypothetical protein
MFQENIFMMKSDPKATESIGFTAIQSITVGQAHVARSPDNARLIKPPLMGCTRAEKPKLAYFQTTEQ